jgi:hypothetical protein
MNDGIILPPHGGPLLLLKEEEFIDLNESSKMSSKSSAITVVVATKVSTLSFSRIIFECISVGQADAISKFEVVDNNILKRNRSVDIYFINIEDSRTSNFFFVS